MPFSTRVARARGPLIVFVVAVVLAITLYALTPSPILAAGGYPGPDALPGVPTYGGVLGTIPVGHSATTYVCGFDAPNLTNHSPKDAAVYIDGHLDTYAPISTQYGCVQITVYVSLYNAQHMIAPCGYVYVQVNSGPWILVPVGLNQILVTGVKHYQHVGAIFPFYVPTPPSAIDYCPHVATTTTTTVPHRTTTTLPIPIITLTPTSSTLPGYRTTSSRYNAGSTSTVPSGINTTPGTTLSKITEVVVIVAVISAAAAVGQFIGQIPESLVEEYTSEIEPGGGLPYDDFPAGGVGALAEVEETVVIAAYDSDIPPGGGYPFGSVVPEGTVAGGFVTPPLEIEVEVVTFIIAAEDTEIPPGGGAPNTRLNWRTGGLADTGGAESSGGGLS